MTPGDREERRPTYTEYRSYGHGPLTAFSLSCDPFVWWPCAVALGTIVGVLWSHLS